MLRSVRSKKRKKNNVWCMLRQSKNTSKLTASRNVHARLPWRPKQCNNTKRHSTHAACRPWTS